MNQALTVSLVIVSRHRPKDLRLLLTSLRYLDYPKFEVIVVCPDDPRSDFPNLFNIDRVKYVPFDQANISAARNAGINAAAGEIIAFCDDDAVPEPTWLTHLTEPFADASVAATGGFVRGRNGISFQWRGRSFDCTGAHGDLPIADTKPQVFSGNATKGIKTEGTNCAFRRNTLQELGGFDENIRYFLDETDLNYRLGLAGHKTAIVPLAQVHHGFAASNIRATNRAPRDLFEIGASSAYFFCKFNSTEDFNGFRSRLRTQQRNRLIGFMVRGDLEPGDIPRLMHTLQAGIAKGLDMTAGVMADIKTVPDQDFTPFTVGTAPKNSAAFAGRFLAWRQLQKDAAASAGKGLITTVFRYSASSLFHRVRFHSDGYWLHTGGIYGRGRRSEKMFRLTTLKKRTLSEQQRLSAVRPISEMKYV